MGRYMLSKNITQSSLVSMVSKITRPFLKTSIWVSGTKVANYLLKDPVIDWLNLYYSKYGLNTERQLRCKKNKNHKIMFKRPKTSNPLFANGNLFEETVYAELSSKFGSDFVNLKGEVIDCSFEKTKEQMRHQTPVIAQAFIKSDILNLRGVVDLLVRNDYINKIVKNPIHGMEAYENLFYVPIDIKWSNMELCVDGETIRNSGRFRANKGQLLIYTTILEEMQNFHFPTAFILSKSWNIDKKASGSNCFERLGVINFSGKDKDYVESTSNAINWIRNVTQNGSGWSPLFPHIKEMCCNACNVDDAWDDVKKKIMRETKDITQVWMVTPEQRNIAFDKGIRRWDDHKCTSETLGVNGVNKETIKNILKMNKNQRGITFSKEKIHWGEVSSDDFFIDFETISDEYKELKKIDVYNGKSRGALIFMVGIGYISHGNFIYKNFTASELSDKGECDLIKTLHLYVSELSSKPRFFHWGHVEQTMLESAIRRHSLRWEGMEWVDMYRTLVNAHFAVTGALCFKLKEIATAMYNLGYIKTTWTADDDSGNDFIKDGLSAMKQSIDFYAGKGDLKPIIKYNEIDCKVLWEIYEFIEKREQTEKHC